MAHHISSKKRIRQIKKRTQRNKSLRSFTRSAIKKFRVILENGKKEDFVKSFNSLQSSIDKAISKGILHRKTADRYKSRLSSQMAKLI